MKPYALAKRKLEWATSDYTANLRPFNGGTLIFYLASVD